MESLKIWLLKFGYNSTRLRTTVETFVYWLANGTPPWMAYHAFMYGRLIMLDKHPGVRPVGLGETWWRLFTKIVLKVTRPESTMAFQYYHLCARLKAVIDGAIHRVQAI